MPESDPTTDPTPPVDPTLNTGPEKTPEWYERELTKTRTEAGNYRTKLREAETRLAGAKSQEDIDAALADLTATNSRLARDLLVAAAGEGLPAELRELLKGDTEAELKAHAEVLKKFAPATPPGTTPPALPASLQGGLDPSAGTDAFDPAAFATAWRAGSGSRAFISGRQ